MNSANFSTEMVDAAKISNVAAGLVVGKIGVAVVTPDELLRAWMRLKERLA